MAVSTYCACASARTGNDYNYIDGGKTRTWIVEYIRLRRGRQIFWFTNIFVIGVDGEGQHFN